MAIKNKYVYGDSICLLRNKYPIKGTIIPQYRLTATQIDEIFANVKLSLLNNLNSSKLNFGEEIDYDTVYKLITDSDERIKSVMMDDITYATYATYLYIDKTNAVGDVPHFLDIRIDEKENQLHSLSDLKLGYTITQTNPSAGTGYTFNTSTFQDKTNWAHGTFTFTKESNDTWTLRVEQGIYDIDDVNGDLNSKIITLTSNGLLSYGISVSDSTLDEIEIEVKGLYDLPYVVHDYEANNGAGADIEFESIFSYIRAMILTRSILAGKTPYFLSREDVPAQTLNQAYSDVAGKQFHKVENVNKLKLEGVLTEGPVEANAIIFNVDEHTAVEFTSPNLLTTDEYSNYVKYEYLINNDINADINYTLGDGEHIAFYWSADENSGNNYAVYGKGTIIQPTFILTSNTTSTLPEVLATKLSEAIASGNNYIKGATYLLGSDTIDDYIDSLDRQGKILSSTKKVLIKKKNLISLDDSMYCSWILNDAEGEYSVLFGVGEQERVLKNGEYFMYTNRSKSSLVILGQGTKITRDTSTWDGVWQCKTTDYSGVVANGLEALISNSGTLVSIPKSEHVDVIEMQYIAVPSGGAIRIKATPGPLPDRIIINGGEDGSLVDEYGNEFELNEDVSVEYRFDDDSEFTAIQLNSSGSDTWKLNCIGLIDIKPKERFVLNKNQNLLISSQDLLDESAIEITIDGDNTPYIMSNSSVYGEGEVSVDKIYLTYYDIIESQVAENKSNSKIDFTDSGYELSCTFDMEEYEEGDTISNSIEISTLPGNYVARIDLSSFSAVSNLYWEIEILVGDAQAGQKFNCYYGECNSIFYTIPDTSSEYGEKVTIVFTLKTVASVFPSSGKFTLPLSGYRMYEINPYVDEITGVNSVNGSNSEISKIISYLRNRCVGKKFNFDYSYEVDEDDIVRYPLTPASFFDYNHVYNQYTIPQYDIDSFYSSDKGLYITNKVR